MLSWHMPAVIHCLSATTWLTPLSLILSNYYFFFSKSSCSHLSPYKTVNLSKKRGAGENSSPFHLVWLLSNWAVQSSSAAWQVLTAEISQTLGGWWWEGTGELFLQGLCCKLLRSSGALTGTSRLKEGGQLKWSRGSHIQQESNRCRNRKIWW